MPCGEATRTFPSCRWCAKLIVCPADYSPGSEMDVLVRTIIDKIDLDDRLEKLEAVK